MLISNVFIHLVLFKGVTTLNTTTEEIRNEFEQNGYYICRQGLELDKVALLEDALRLALVNGDAEYNDLSLDELVLLRESQDHKKVYDAAVSVGSSFAGMNVLSQSKILEISTACSGALSGAVHNMPLHVAIQNPSDGSFDYGWHQESAFYDWCPDILNIWFPLVRPSTTSAGTMSVLPQSHLNGKLPYNDFLNEAGFRQLNCEIDSVKDTSEVDIEINVGDFVIFHSDLIHKSKLNFSKLPRYSGILRIVNMSTQPNYRALYKAWSNNPSSS